MARADREFAVRTKGLAELNRALGRVDKDFRRDVVRELRATAKEVRGAARPLTPVRTGALQRSLRFSATNRGAAVSSNLPYAGWIEYGGTISPRGAPITVKPSRMLGRAVEAKTADIEDDLGRLFDSVARRAGF